MELNPFLPDGVLGYQVGVLFEEHIASPPWGRRERGYSKG